MIKTIAGQRIKLPTSDDGVKEYHIEHKPFLGKIQEENFIKLKETFEPFNITFGKIWYGTFVRTKQKYFKDDNGNSQIEEKQNTAINFLIESTDKKVYWRKYEALVEGGTQTSLYFGKKKIKLTSWFSWSHERRSEFISLHL